MSKITMLSLAFSNQSLKMFPSEDVLRYIYLRLKYIYTVSGKEMFNLEEDSIGESKIQTTQTKNQNSILVNIL